MLKVGMDGVRLTPPKFVRPLPALEPGWPNRLMVLVFVHMVLERGRRTLVKPDVIDSAGVFSVRGDEPFSRPRLHIDRLHAGAIARASR